MKVVHILKATGLAGAERHLLHLLPRLRTHGVQPEVLLLTDRRLPAEDFADALRAEAIPVARLPLRHHADLRVLAPLRESLRAIRPAIVHTHLIHADLYGVIAARRARVEWVVSSRHNDDPFRSSPPMRLLLAVMWRQIDRGITISRSLESFTRRVEYAPSDRLVTIPYGIPPQPPLDRAMARQQLLTALDLPPDSLVIALVGRLTRQKGMAYGLRAFAQIAGRFPALHLIIVGDGVLRPALAQEAGALGVDGRTHFLGWRRDVPQLMAAADLFVMPSLWEGFGLVLLEAMAQATPIIASRVSAIPEIVIDGETGRLVPAADPAALADAIYALLTDVPLRRYLGLMAQDRLETVFSADRMAAETFAVYQALVNTPQKRRWLANSGGSKR